MGCGRRRTQRAGALRVGGADVEVRSLPIVAHEERAAVLEPAVEMHDGNARAVAPGRDPVTRLENEAARVRHERIVPLNTPY